ncbi:hypothetical protein BDD12DRAFT_57741 [Trichophaea hybrida]|nr:hypothetical protein BDD12DRAFT_57741 [Trichophaea hybrida]
MQLLNVCYLYTSFPILPTLSLAFLFRKQLNYSSLSSHCTTYCSAMVYDLDPGGYHPFRSAMGSTIHCSNDLPPAPQSRFRYVAVKILAADEKYEGHILRQLRPESLVEGTFSRVFSLVAGIWWRICRLTAGQVRGSRAKWAAPLRCHRVTRSNSQDRKGMLGKCTLLPLEIGHRTMMSCL